MSNFTLDYSSQYALLYDIITGHKDYKTESDFLHELIMQHHEIGESHTHLLSVGCGTGSHELCLDRLGLTITGIDTSTPMIQRAKSKPFERSIFTASSINNFSLPHRSAFDAAISLFNVVNCLADINELVEFLSAVAYSLKPKSLFFFECWNMLPCILKPPEIVTRNYCDPNEEYTIVRTAVPKLDAATQKLTLDYNINGVYAGKKVDITSTHSLTLFTQIEYEYALERAGFKDIHFGPSLADKVLSKKVDNNTRMLGVHAIKSVA